jgi:hypothetical protein
MGLKAERGYGALISLAIRGPVSWRTTGRWR